MSRGASAAARTGVHGVACGSLLTALLLIAGCMHLPPKTVAPTLRSAAPVLKPAQPASDAAAGTADWPQQQWWLRYADPDLSALIERAQGQSPSLEAAQARFAAAQASVRSAAALLGVHVDASADFARQRLSDNGLLPAKFLGFHWYNQADLGLSVTYEFDWWGRERAQIDSALDSARAANAEHAEATLLLTTSIAEAYFGWQSDQAQLTLSQLVIDNLQQQRDLAQLRVNANIARPDDLEQADSTLSLAREQQDALNASVQLRRVTLAALLACDPDQLPTLNVRPLPALQAGLPENIGLDLIARRPDIQASRWRVEAATRGVDAARAGFLPDVSLKALAGLSSIDIGKLIEYGSRVPMAEAAVHLPIFDAGALRGQYEASRAQLASAIATYDDSVIGAAREVNTQSVTLAQLAAQRTRRAEQAAIAERLRVSAQARSDAGLTDARPALSAVAQWLQAEDALLQLDASALQADLELIRALGGGYQNTVDANTTSSNSPPSTNPGSH